MSSEDLKELFKRVTLCFPKEKRALFRAPAEVDAWETFEEAYPSGHAKRWFEVTDGQAESEVFVDGLRLVTLEEASVRGSGFESQDEGAAPLSLPSHWFTIAEGAGCKLLIDDRDGRVLLVFDESGSEAKAMAPSAADWLESLLRDFESREWVWDEDVGLTDRASLERLKQLGSPQKPALRRPNVDWQVGHLLAVLLTIACVAWMVLR